MHTSLFDLFKIGIGPSSSHTVGPMRAARAFAESLAADGRLAEVDEVKVELYGSLALTGKGHGTDRAILLGLEGEQPDQIDPASIEPHVARIRESKTLHLAGARAIAFDEDRHLLLHKNQTLSEHSNGMRFSACGLDVLLQTRVYYSIGGGFILAEGETVRETRAAVPIPFSNAAELLAAAEERGLKIWQVMLENEKAWRSEDEIREGIRRIWLTMQDCAQRGLTTPGVLPGGLNVRRRAPPLREKLEVQPGNDALNFIDWVNLYAIAVNEENAAGGRVVTAPTNGAAGVIPAVAHYYARFTGNPTEEGLLRFFLTAAAIGVLYKENASISGAEVGCQGEVGVACSMAAGGLVAALEGGNAAVEHAAEIAMEHNLGMTCDPVGGLVQIPCIERNAFGAVKAINAARMALVGQDEHKVSLDQVIRTMYQTGKDMNTRYKETSLGGLALSVIEC